MRSTALRLAIAAIAIAAFMGLASSAMAFTISPTGAVTGTSTDTKLTLTSSGLALTCATSSVTATVNSAGAGTVAVGGLTYGGCTNSTFGSFVVTQRSALTVSTSLLTSPVGVLILFTLPARAVNIHSQLLNCDFTVTGTAGILIPGPLPITATRFTLNLSNLRVDSTGGGCALAAPLNLGASYTGNYNLNHSLIVTG